MWYYVSKVLISALIVVAISEVAKRNSGFAALIASLPLTSLVAIIWLRIEGSQAAQIAELSQQIFWLVIPSLAFFLVFATMLKQGLAFWPSLSCACLITIFCYLITMQILRRFGIFI
jgi:hypothetical protein